MDQLRIGQLTKELVAEELRLLGDPTATAGEVVRRTVKAALANLPPGTAPFVVIEDAARGAITAILLADQSLTRGAMRVLEAVLEIAAENNLDPTESMRAALRGLADLRRFVDPSRVDDVRVEIDAKYMGAGEVFVEFLREPLAK